MLDDRKNNYIASIYKKGLCYGYAYSDVSTGEFFATDISIGNNFEKLVNEGFYDGLTFHRVVDEFMAQGGDPKGDGTGGSPDTIKGEFAANGVDNSISHQRGVVSMARSMDYDSASSQFFICYTGNYASSLDGQYAAFANVTEGMEVVDDFMKVERDLNSMGELATPKTPIVMEKVEMIDPDPSGSPRVKITVNDFIK
ncbi:MAG: peptidylprolyl isomerase [Ruminococcus sp.]|nr:peptidylprolyl isomerase [Ruminococcus sp.]